MVSGRRSNCLPGKLVNQGNCVVAIGDIVTNFAVALLLETTASAPFGLEPFSLPVDDVEQDCRKLKTTTRITRDVSSRNESNAMTTACTRDWALIGQTDFFDVTSSLM